MIIIIIMMRYFNYQQSYSRSFIFHHHLPHILIVSVGNDENLHNFQIPLLPLWTWDIVLTLMHHFQIPLYNTLNMSGSVDTNGDQQVSNRNLTFHHFFTTFTTTSQNLRFTFSTIFVLFHIFILKLLWFAPI